ncbi:hypothetical protein WBG06_06105 [Nocardioides sp. CCNWLW239]|uniref:hypothetical protein n=1 Tax=Nocardioides sp. CCNWLW239 TaxID=3128902 RepID=UPI003017DACE
MRAFQRVIAGSGIALGAVVAVALLIAGSSWLGPDSADRSAQQAAGPSSRLGDGPTGPPQPIDAAEDTSVGTLPPPPDASDASDATQLISSDLLAPPTSAQGKPRAGKPADGATLSARKTRNAKKPADSGQVPTMPGFTMTRDGWEWIAGDEGDHYGDSEFDRDGDDCRREHRDDRYDYRYDRRDSCDRRD